jgi:hypothetical protein
VTHLVGGFDATRLARYGPFHLSDGAAALATAGPVSGRDIELLDPAHPGLRVAACTELIVPARLPHAVAAALSTAAEPLAQLLDNAGLDWRSQHVPGAAPTAPAADGCDRAALTCGTLHMLRRLWVAGGRSPCALLCEELYLDTLLDPPGPGHPP